MKFTVTEEQLALIVLRSQEIHEASYVRGEDISYRSYGNVEMTFPTGEYKKDHMVSSIEACAEILGGEHAENGLPYVVYLLNATAWNDVQLWAQDVLGLKPVGESDETETDLPADVAGDSDVR